MIPPHIDSVAVACWDSHSLKRWRQSSLRFETFCRHPILNNGNEARSSRGRRSAVRKDSLLVSKSSNLSLMFAWIVRLIVAVILLQTLFFKFTAAPESVYIFSTVGAEPWGRIGTGIIELIAAALILIPRTSWMGALTAMAVMAGAILAHLTVLGIDVQGDSGLLFALAWIALAASGVTLLIERGNIPYLRGELR